MVGYITDTLGPISQFFTELVNLIIPGADVPNSQIILILFTALVFGILIYIAFRYFVFERLMKAGEGGGIGEGPSNGFSITLAIASSVVGIYLGFIPFLAAVMPAFFIVIIGVFAIILTMGVHGMYVRQKGEHWTDVGEASEQTAAGKQKWFKAKTDIKKAKASFKGDKPTQKELDRMVSRVRTNIADLKGDLAVIDQMIVRAKSFDNPANQLKASAALLDAIKRLKSNNDAVDELWGNITNRIARANPIYNLNNIITKLNDARILAGRLDPAYTNRITAVIQQLEQLRLEQQREATEFNQEAEIKSHFATHFAALKNKIAEYRQKIQSGTSDANTSLNDAHTALVNILTVVNTELKISAELEALRNSYAARYNTIDGELTALAAMPPPQPAAAAGGAGAHQIPQQLIHDLTALSQNHAIAGYPDLESLMVDIRNGSRRVNRRRVNALKRILMNNNPASANQINNALTQLEAHI